MSGRDWDREIALYARQQGLTEEETGLLQRFVDQKMRLDSVEVSIDSVSYSGRTTQAFTMADTEETDLLPALETTPEKRYLDLGPIGQGGMGEVRRVRDVVLNRFMAMKILRPEYTGSQGAIVRFVAEAQATAQLQHPGVVPVHDIGQLPDGRWFFTMKELAGATLEDVVLEYLAGRGRQNLRGLVDLLARMCDALAYAHAHGAIHRDVKPANVLVGAFGEVVVLDWGLVKATGSPETTAQLVTDLGRLKTKMGSVVGTPAYMPPEQARGAHDEVGPFSDVYAVGAVLYEILTGRRPYEGEATQVIGAILAGPPEPLHPSIPPGLAEICTKAMAREPADRFQDAGELGAALRGWLDGAEREERALAIVRKADSMQPEVEFALQASERYAREAEEILDRIPPEAPVSKKAPGWALQEKADAERLRADLIGIERLQLLRSALNEMPGLIDIHERLAYVYHFCHARAERLGDAREVAQYAQLLRDHDRGQYTAYLEGTGELTLRTRPPGAAVKLYEFQTVERRLVPVLAGELPETPFDRVPLGLGSWLLVLEAPGRAPVRFPVCVGRNEHVHTIEPGGKVPVPVALPWSTQVGPEDCYVPGGWTQLGPRPTQRAWVDPFVMRRFPVTNAEYMEFLDDLLRQGRLDEAERYQPRTAGGPCYARSENGFFRPPSDPDNDAWLADRPVTCIDHTCATAFAEWLSARTGFDWRLPWEDEWEKAARGVDGRTYVMGETLDPTWADVRGSVQDPAYKPVGAYPDDESVYGVRSMTGLVGEWCADAWRPSMRLDMDRVIRRAARPDEGSRAVWRGGFRNIPHDQARAFVRQGALVGRRLIQIGFRLARNLEPDLPDDDISGVWVLADREPTG
ncbi:MAG: bifunctional serine/threonine-protein kinase/formylglycine-generating enzyme family protein [Myxococcota bacterium]